MHYYQFHIGDYKSHTHHLSLMEDLAFRRLLDHYYLHEAPIKQRDIARQIGMREHEQDVLTVLNEFFVSTEQGFVNPRADAEITKFKEFSEAGKRGAAKRWSTPPNGEANSPPNATPIATNNHKPITNNQEPKKKATAVACPPDVSEAVWLDWLQLRKAKKAPVTLTVVNSVIKEAEKAGISLNAFLTIWCARGSQGLQAEWLKSNERQQFVNKYDVAHVTTPTPPNQDAALRKIEEDAKKAAPIPENIRAKMAAILGDRK